MYFYFYFWSWIEYCCYLECIKSVLFIVYFNFMYYYLNLINEEMSLERIIVVMMIGMIVIVYWIISMYYLFF